MSWNNIKAKLNEIGGSLEKSVKNVTQQARETFTNVEKTEFPQEYRQLEQAYLF